MNSINMLLAVTICALLTLGCGKSGNSNSTNASLANNTNQNKLKRDVKPADFTVSAEELGEEFDKASKLERKKNYADYAAIARYIELLDKKYGGKTIVVSGQISSIRRKNRGSSSDALLLYTERLQNSAMEQYIECRFQESDATFEALEAGATVDVQGSFQKENAYSPRLGNCVVVEVK